MYPRLLTTVVALSESLDARDRVDSVEIDDAVGVDTDRSSAGTASKAGRGTASGGGESSLTAMLLLNSGISIGISIIMVVVMSNWCRLAARALLLWTEEGLK